MNHKLLRISLPAIIWLAVSISGAEAHKVIVVDSFDIPHIRIASWTKQGNVLVVLSDTECASQRITLGPGSAAPEAVVKSNDQWGCAFQSITGFGNNLLAVNKADGSVNQLEGWNDASSSHLISLPSPLAPSVPTVNAAADGQWAGQIAYDGNYVYVCSEAGWSSAIWRIRSGSEKREFVVHISGKPAGLSWNNGQLWYLGNRTTNKYNAIIYRIDIAASDAAKTKAKFALSAEVPCKEGRGIYAEGDFLWCLDNFQKKLMKLSIN